MRGAPSADQKYRVAVIGHTGRGNYGHGLDSVWLELPDTQIVGVADANPQGLAQAIKRLGSPQGFSDYRKMLDRVKPDLVSVAPSRPDAARLSAADVNVPKQPVCPGRCQQ